MCLPGPPVRAASFLEAREAVVSTCCGGCRVVPPTRAAAVLGPEDEVRLEEGRLVKKGKNPDSC